MFSQLPPRNNTSFSRAIATAAAALKATPGETALQYHQRIPVQYLVESGRRGLYLYHHMGSGKSRTGGAAAEALAEALPDWHVLFVSTKSLHSNFAEELKKYYAALDIPESEWAGKLAKYKFVSSNASNMLVQLRRTQSTTIDLERTIVIIDEVHEMCNAIANGSANARGFYNAIMRTRDLKLLCLSGTPITGDPFEFALAMNMVAGRDAHGQALFGESYAAFVEAFVNRPEALDVDVVEEPPAKKSSSKFPKSVDEDESKHTKKTNSESVRPDPPQADPDAPTSTNLADSAVSEYPTPQALGTPMIQMRNMSKFVSRIIGLVSCYNPQDDVASGARDMFPTQLPQIVQSVPMSPHQYAAYSIAREHELEEARRRVFNRGPSDAMARSSGGAQSTYRVASRQLGDFAFPDHAAELTRTAGRLHYTRYVDKLTQADLTTDLGKYSPKMCMIIATLLRYTPASAGKVPAALEAVAVVGRRLQAERKIVLPKDPAEGLGIVYSQFNESGIEALSAVLEACGCERVRMTPPVKIPADRAGKVAEVVDETDETIHDGDDVDSDDDVSKDTSSKKGGADRAVRRARALRGRGEKVLPLGKASGVLRFGVINGSTEIWERDALRAEFRDRDNVAGTFAGGKPPGKDGAVGADRGSGMAWLLFTVVGATGTNTEGVTHVHKMESYWKPSRDAQVDTRANRYKSHTMLPKSLRFVQTFIYLSDYPDSVRAKWAAAGVAPPEPTTDWQLYRKSANLAAINEVFLLAIDSASIDCTLWSAALLARHGMHCHMCAPTDSLLFLESFRDDIADTTVRCRAPATSDVKAHILELDGVKYAAYMDGTQLRIVMYDAGLAGYVPIGPAHPQWDVLLPRARKATKS